MTQTVFFALQERETGRLMPASKYGTRTEFGDNGSPRLFTKKNAAAQALNCWRMGIWRLIGDDNGYMPEPPDPKQLWNTDTIARRQATEVDVVEMFVAVRSPRLL